ncbi:hypothetical protein FB45DRAFT_298185 [Roridomyces roridus]|uniref:F-box domain-containing protein n=1 Tax=Roridomyces roridus TaxID=1738132 RepID=A0AAD7FXK6_9AGAR|nr:hypothetical protein FB45DRAFT_298185 [Roridomyces roridus]
MDISSVLMLGHSTASSFESQAKDLIRAAEANVARIDSQIRDLVRLRERERGLIATLKLVVAPVRKLPAELLVEIFQWTLISLDWGLPKQALAISHVCAHWRQLACTTPQFWTQPFRPDLTKAQSDVYLVTTKLIVERSAPLPIPVTLEKEAPGANHPLAELAFSLARRWRSLCCDHTQMDRLEKLPMDALRRLESVNITTNLACLVDINIFLGAHRLRTVTLDVVNVDCFHMPWSQLTEVTIGHGFSGNKLAAQICLDILVQCTNVVTAKFGELVPWTERPAAGPITRLPHLKMLQVEFNVDASDDHLTPFFARLALPALTHLTIYGGCETFWSTADFEPFQKRSPNIEQLNIEGPPLHPDALISLLAASPNLVKLDLERCFIQGAVDPVIRFLQYFPTDQVHSVPRLQRIHIFGSFGGHFDEAVLENMIVSRWWTDAQLLAMPGPPPVARLKSCWISDADEEQQYSDAFRNSRAGHRTVTDTAVIYTAVSKHGREITARRMAA